MADINEMYIGSEPVKEMRFAKAVETAQGYDVSTQECWDAYAGSTHVYHKDKTVENCWKKYGLLSEPEDSECYSLDMAAVPEGKTGVLPEVIDWQQHVLPSKGSGLKGIRWNAAIADTGFWEKLNEYIATHDIVVVSNAPSDSGFTADDDNHDVTASRWFYGSNRRGDFRVNLNGYNQYAQFPNMFYFMNIDKLTICFKTGSVHISSAIRLFRYLTVKQIEVLNADGTVANGTGNKYISAYDISAIGENMTYPGVFPDIIDWKQRQNIDGYACTRIGYAFTQCKQMTGIAQCATATERDSDENTIRAHSLSDQAFENCFALTSIGPVLDLAAVSPSTGKENQSGSGAYRIFAGCSALADVRIKNLNAGLWRFDDDQYVGNVPNLDAESIEYLFANLMDLTGEVTGVSTPSNNFMASGWGTSWLTGERSVSQAATGARLPNTWPDYFLTVNKAVTLDVHVSGLQAGDRLEWGTGSAAPAASESSITTDGDYTLTGEDGVTYGFRLYNDNITDNKYYTDNEHKVTITLKNPYQPAGIKGNSGTIHCPAGWDGKVTQAMVNAASAKGWTVYVGGVLQLPVVALYDVAAQGATNESLSANPTLTDLSGNGHDIALSGFDFKGMSGAGGYPQKSYLFSKNDSSYDVINNGPVISFRKTGAATSHNFLGIFKRVNNWNTNVENKVKAGQYGIVLYATEESGANKEPLLTLQPYETGGFTYDQSFFDSGKDVLMASSAIDAPAGDYVSFEFLPLYPGALVSDGVDDYGHAGSFPAVKSMIVKYKFYDYDFTGDASTEGFEYAFEIVDSDGTVFRRYKDVETGDIAGTPLTWQQLSDDTFYAENNADAGFDLNLFSSIIYGTPSGFGRVAFYKMALFDHALSEEELEAAKAKFTKNDETT